MRDSSQIRQYRELGENLIIIVKRLLANDDLVNLLYYEDKDPLGRTYLTDQEKQEKVFEKLLMVTPRLPLQENAQSHVAVRIDKGTRQLSNTEFREVQIKVELFVPLTQWFIKGTNLRPFAIMSEIEKSLQGKTINGLGKIIGGDFELNFLTDEMSAYEMTYWIVQYE